MRHLSPARLLLLGWLALPGAAFAQDASAPAILQMFESTYKNTEKRAPDIFMAGYGAMWLPPPGRADQGNLSAGYDVYDRFDLGGPGNATLYGSEKGLKTLVQNLHRANSLVYTDLIWNHNGFSNLGTPGFEAAGGYPGFSIRLQTSNPSAPGYNTRGYSDVDGDFHGAFETGDINGRLSGLIDIAQEKNWQFIRSPVPGFANNIPAGTTPAFGRLANVPAESNRRLYPDRDLPGMTVFDPNTNETITIYPYNTANPMAGDPVEENATGYLMRQAQWMIQEIGIDGFRLDAVKHMHPWVQNFFDRAVYQAIQKPLLDGSQQHTFSFGEVFDGNRAFVQQFIKKNLNSGTPGLVRGNRDALDFPLFFAMSNNLTSNGLQNDWRNVVNASQDAQDGGANNGSQGVAFVQSHDSFGPHLDNTAYAYTLMRPGQAIVYFNAKEFGNGRSFPKDGRGDALGGLHGDRITDLVEIRNTHGRGNYIERVLTKEALIYERENSAIVALANRLDNGSDLFNSVQTSFSSGTRLVEMTGNAADATVDPPNVIPELLTVDASGRVNVRIPRQKNINGVEHKRGYLIYGLPTPQGSLNLSNVAMTIPAETPTASTNGTARLTPIDVIKLNSFNVTLQTTPVVLSDGFHDLNADGDGALIRFNGGIDLNASGTVDFVSPGSVSYGFENFVTKSSPLFGGGDGEFIQSIDATGLPEGMNYLTVRAFRHSTNPGTPVIKDFRKVLYIDRLKPVSSIDSTPSLGGNNRQVRVRSNDLTANIVHTFLNLPAALTEAQILAMVSGSNQAGQIDRDLFAFGYNNVPNGNNVVTVVTYEISGTYNVQRLAGINMGTTVGIGLGDLNFSNSYTTSDVSIFENTLYSQNAQFNPAGDINADGKINNHDLFLLRPRYVSQSAPAGVINEARNAELRRGNLNGDDFTNAADIDHLYQNFGSTSWLYDLDVDESGADQQDVDVLIRQIFLTEYGDANLDRQVNLSDFNILAGNFGSNIAGWATADFTGDGLVTLSDFNVLASQFGFVAAGPNGPTPQDWAALASAVPEPASLGVLLIGLCSLSRRNRRLARRIRGAS